MATALPIDPEIYSMVKQKQLELTGIKRRMISLTEITDHLILLGLTHTDDLIKEIE